MFEDCHALGFQYLIHTKVLKYGYGFIIVPSSIMDLWITLQCASHEACWTMFTPYEEFGNDS